MRRILLTICIFGVFASCLLAQQIHLVKPQPKPSSTAAEFWQVFVANTSAEAVPVAIVPADPNGGVMFTVAENDTSTNSVHFVDLREFKYFSFYANSQTDGFEFDFVDDPVRPTVGLHAGSCVLHGEQPVLACSARYQVAGPYLKIRNREGSERGMGTVKIYLQKN